MEQHDFSSLSEEDRALVDAARAACNTAYAPYSGVAVGAALATEAGIVTGSNVENAAYGATICAERMAVGRANAQGERAFSAVAIAARGDVLGADQVISPCGACRQVLYEMAASTGMDTRVLMTTPATGSVTVATIRELLPLPFGGLGR